MRDLLVWCCLLVSRSAKASLEGFPEELKELAGAMVTGRLRSRIHSLMGGVVLADIAGPTARSGQEPHTPGGTDLTSVDLGSLRRHRGLWVWLGAGTCGLASFARDASVIPCGGRAWFARTGSGWVAVGRDVSAMPSFWGGCRLRDAPAIPWSV